MGHPFSFRPGTQDEGVFHEVVHANSYQLPEVFRGDEVVVDVGANIGAFTFAALIRGAGEVHAFEADHENFEAARGNLRDFEGRVNLHHAAVWRSDRRDGVLYFNTLVGKAENTACGHVLEADHGTPVEARPLDDVIEAVTEGGRRRIDLLKIDCEGAEYPILFTAKRLRQIDCVVGEFHNFASGVPEGHPFHTIPERAKVAGYDRFTDAELIPYLRRSGFEVSVRRHETIPHLLGVFVARRPAGRLARLTAAWKGRGKVLLGSRS